MSDQRWHCRRCGLVSTSYAAAERHAREAEHGRIETINGDRITEPTSREQAGRWPTRP